MVAELRRELIVTTSNTPMRLSIPRVYSATPGRRGPLRSPAVSHQGLAGNHPFEAQRVGALTSRLCSGASDPCGRGYVNGFSRKDVGKSYVLSNAPEDATTDGGANPSVI
jgi:hypothetical protein